jgi:chemotaxis protein methyltransferase WspC
MTPIAKLHRLTEPSATLLAEFAAIAAATAGMTPSMLDRRALRQTLHRRMEATGHPTPDTYAAHYRDSAAEQSAFLEGILNNETCFFRDTVVFAELQRWCLDWFATNQRPMRILSAPCSTGEEPYSIAAMLEQYGISLDRFTLEALDLSASAITHARLGIYTGLSLRNIPHPAQTTFLDRAAHGWQVRPHLRNHVQFRQANLLASNALPPRSYDLICSRNLLIYQTPEARRQVAQTLAAALTPSGRLVLGAADWGRDLDPLFQLEAPVNSFALRLRSATPSTAPQTSSTPPAITTSTTTRKPPTRHVETSDDLAKITAIYRLALESYASGNERESERLCRQALYLDNDHLPSLELLAKIKRPNASTRITQALHARLERHRVAQGGTV